MIIGGRLADPSMFLAPLAHRFGWDATDMARMGAGTLVGHLLECGMQVTGGYFADPGVKEVGNLAQCGYPIAEVEADGSAVITKLAGSGGCVTPATVKEQLLYEVHDPARYLTPDVTADFSRVDVAAAGADRVKVSNASGTARPATLKVTVGFDGGFQGEAGVSYAGPAAQERGQLAAEIMAERMARVHGIKSDLRIDLIGVSSLFATAGLRAADAQDVRLHVALRARKKEDAETMLWEVESLLCCGPAGGGGYRGAIAPCVMTKSVLIERERVKPSCRSWSHERPAPQRTPYRARHRACARRRQRQHLERQCLGLRAEGFRAAQADADARAHQAGLSAFDPRDGDALRAAASQRLEFRFTRTRSKAASTLAQFGLARQVVELSRSSGWRSRARKMRRRSRTSIVRCCP